MITTADITVQVRQSVEANGVELAQGIDIDGVVRSIVATYGWVDIDEIDADDYWAIIRRHDSTQA